MNLYGRTALNHWRRWLPNRFRQIEDPQRYFEDLGEEIRDRVAALWPALAGDDPPAEQYLEKVGRLNMARLNAESQAMRELALLDPETSELEEEAPSGQENDQAWIPIREDPTHPWWRQAASEDDNQSQAPDDPTI
jgi:hypothetical protein